MMKKVLGIIFLILVFSSTSFGEEDYKYLKDRLGQQNESLKKLEAEENKYFKPLIPYYDKWKEKQLKIVQLDNLRSKVNSRVYVNLSFEEKVLYKLQDCFKATYLGKEFNLSDYRPRYNEIVQMQNFADSPRGCFALLDKFDYEKLYKLMSKDQGLFSPILLFLKQARSEPDIYGEEKEYSKWFNDPKSEYSKLKKEIESSKEKISQLEGDLKEKEKEKITQEAQLKLDQAASCSNEFTIKNNGLKELVTNVSDEVSFFEDMVYSFEDCRDLELSSKNNDPNFGRNEGKDFCSRFQNKLKGALCRSHFQPYKYNCDNPDKSSDPLKLLSCQLSELSKTKSPDCQQDYTSELMVSRFFSKCHEYQTQAINMDSEEFKSLRKILSQNITEGVPVGFESQNQTFSIIGIKPDGDHCSYLIRNYGKKEEEWVPEKDILPKIEKLKFMSNKNFGPDLFKK